MSDSENTDDRAEEKGSENISDNLGGVIEPSVNAKRKEADVQILDMKVEGASDPDAPVSPEFFAVPNENYSRQKRGKGKIVGIIVAVVICILVVGGIIYFINNSSSEQADGGSSSSQSEATLDNMSLDIPDLSSLFGLTEEKALAELGDGFEVSSTEKANIEESTDSVDSTTDETKTQTAESTEEVQADTTDETNVEEYVTITPKSGSSGSPTIVLWLDSNGKTIGVEYKCDMGVCGYPDVSFADLVATSTALDATLSMVGVDGSLTTYTPPSADSYTTYSDTDSSKKTVTQESTSFNGSTGNSDAPTIWSVTFTYDYTSGDSTSGEVTDNPTRTVEIALS